MAASSFDIGALGNCTDKIIMQRMNVNVLDEAGKITGSENVAYAWHDDPAQRRRMVYDYVGKNSAGVRQYAWISIDTADEVRKVWREKDGLFSFVSLDVFRSENQLVP